MSVPARPVVVLVVASGAAWESDALGRLNEERGIVVLKRCVDVADLLAASSAGQADVAVLGLESPGLDRSAIDLLRRHGVRPVLVLPGTVDEEPARLRAARIGVSALVPATDLTGLVAAVIGPGDDPAYPAGAEPPARADPDPSDAAGPRGRVIAVWGPAGAPGRTTVAAGLAALLAARGRATTLVDADPYGGSVAQQLGILDEVSGLLAAARLAGTGAFDEHGRTLPRRMNSRLAVVTGLPRADRWVEVRPGVLEALLDDAAGRGDVLVDTGFSIEDEPGAEFGARPGRNHLTLTALARAEEVVVVGSADPVGLSRLARGLVELRPVVEGTPVRVVVNRMRPSLGWSEKEIAGMVTGFLRVADVHFLPEDRASVDRQLLAGQTLAEAGDSALGRALDRVVDVVAPGSLPSPADRAARRPLRRRTAGTAHRR